MLLRMGGQQPLNMALEVVHAEGLAQKFPPPSLHQVTTALRRARQHQDRQGGLRLQRKLRKELSAVEHRQLHVQEHQVRWSGLHESQRFNSIPCACHRVPHTDRMRSSTHVTPRESSTTRIAAI